MKRLRHPINSLREPFGTAGLIVAMIALVAALGGTALAAAKLNSTQKKEVEKIAKKYAGKPGAPGAQGPAGPAGAAGKDGAAGATGEKGATGNTGSPGSPGAAGSPWTAGGTLPSGATETGSVAGVSGEGFVAPLSSAPISFSIPLAAALDEEHVFLIYEAAAVPSHCENAAHAGIASAENPEAGSGYLCVYLVSDQSESTLQGVSVAGGTTTSNGASTAGAVLTLAGGEAGWPFHGTWAVTG